MAKKPTVPAKLVKWIRERSIFMDQTNNPRSGLHASPSMEPFVTDGRALIWPKFDIGLKIAERNLASDPLAVTLENKVWGLFHAIIRYDQQSHAFAIISGEDAMSLGRQFHAAFPAKSTPHCILHFIPPEIAYECSAQQGEVTKGVVFITAMQYSMKTESLPINVHYLSPLLRHAPSRTTLGVIETNTKLLVVSNDWVTAVIMPLVER